MGVHTEKIDLPHLSSVLQKWLISQRRKHCSGSPPSMRRILETPAMFKGALGLKNSEEAAPLIRSGLCSIQNRIRFDSVGEDSSRKSISHDDPRNEEIQIIGDASSEDIEAELRKLSLASLDSQSWDPFSALLTACGQSAPSTLLDVLVTYWSEFLFVLIIS